jgi:hypothetical protein
VIRKIRRLIALGAVVLSTTGNCFALDEKSERIFVLNEKSLVELAKRDVVPSIEKIDVLLEQTVISKLSYSENFLTKLNVGGQYSLTDGKVNKYLTVNTKSSVNYNAEISKNFASGMNLSVGMSNISTKDRVAYNSKELPENYVKPIAFLNYSMDLWKNFFGFTTNNKLKSLKYAEKVAEVGATIEKNNFFNSLRKLYWNMIVVDRQIKLYEYLVSQAQKSYNISLKRFKMSALSEGNLAKSKASLESRKANLGNYQYQYKMLRLRLGEYVPQLNNQKIILDSKIKLEDLLVGIKECVDSVKNDHNAINNTSYTKYIELMGKQLQYELKSLDRYDGADVKLNIGGELSSYSDNASDGYKKLANDEKHYNYYVGLNVSVPFGSRNDNKTAQIKLTKMNFNSTKNGIIGGIRSEYENFEDAMDYLFDTKEYLELSIQSLQKAVKSSKNTYEQGRTELKTLLDDENALAEARTQLIVIYSSIIGKLLDHLTIFDQTICKFNIKY